MNYKNWPIAKQIGVLSLLLTIVVFSVLGSISYFTAAKVLEEKAFRRCTTKCKALLT